MANGMAEADRILASLRQALDELAAVSNLASAGNWEELDTKLAWLNNLDLELQAQRQLIENKMGQDQAFRTEFNLLVSRLQESYTAAMKGVDEWKKGNLNRVGLSRQASDGLSGYAGKSANLSYYIDRSE